MYSPTLSFPREKLGAGVFNLLTLCCASVYGGGGGGGQGWGEYLCHSSNNVLKSRKVHVLSIF